MKHSNNHIPVVLVLAGHDPTGGAGIHADIEAIGRRGCHAATVITALTAQNTTRMGRVLPQSPGHFSEQLAMVNEDMRLAACKIGVCPSVSIMEAMADFLEKRTDLPVVLDPVLVAGTGDEFLEQEALEALRERLLPLATVVTPNSREVRRIGNHIDPADAADALLKMGAHSVLVTGGNDPGKVVVNTLYHAAGDPQAFYYERLPGRFHGSGCTLSAAIAADLTRGEPLATAVMNALDYTWHSLRDAHEFGRDQKHPNRLYQT